MNLLKKRSLCLRLDFNDKIVGEVVTSAADSEITIGRSSKCALRIPNEDRSASSVHAKICRKGKNYFIQDLNSRNGIYFMGEKIRERRIAAGDLYSIGDCKLSVEEYCEETPKGAEQERYHKLEQLTGQNRGKVYMLTESNIKIGSADNCAIVLNDSLVSHFHAVLENHQDGTCWIKDMGSRNGTKVNGTPLTGENAETGRMLKDGDIISIAYLDFRFWDKSAVHIRSHIFLKAGIVAATLAIALGGYFAFQTVSPSAKSIRLKAEALAASGDFETAKALLQSAATARGAESDSSQRLDLMRKLDIWKETLTSWNKIRGLLSGTPGDGDLYDANDLFSELSSSDRERWQWDVVNAAVEMKKAQETHALLSTLLGAEERMKQAEEDASFIRSTREKLARSLAACRKNPQPYQTAIMSRSEDLVGEMDKQIAEIDNVHRVMGECSSAARIDQTISALETIRGETNSRIERRRKDGLAYSQCTELLCKKMLATLRELQSSRKLIDANYIHIAKFEFDKFVDDIRLPSSEACILSPSLSGRRLEMEQDNLRLKQTAVQLKNFQTFFSNHNIAPGMKSALLSFVFDASAWEEVLDCDCLKQPPPSYSEKTARSKYDRMLGVYAFWEYLRSVGNEFDTTIFEERFKPDLFNGKEIFGHLEVFLSFCEPNEKFPFYATLKRIAAENRGETSFGEYVRSAKEILSKRDALIKKMYAMYTEEPDSRRGIIAGGVALCLLPEGGKQFDPKSTAAQLGVSLKKLRKELAQLNERSQNAPPEQRAENSRRLLQIGIPGDGFLKQPWSDLAENGKK